MNVRSHELYLSRIRVAAGEPVPIAGLAELDPGLAADLRAGGLQDVRVSTGPDWKLAAECVGEIAAPDVDAVIYATEGRRDVPEPAQDAARFMIAAGLGEVALFGTGLNQCANLGAVLLLSGSLIRSGVVRFCLAVSVDSAPEGERLIHGDIGLFSDAAVSAVVSGDLDGLPGYRILGVEHATSAELALVPLIQQRPRAASAFIRAAEDAARRLSAATGVAPGQYAYVISNNYVSSAVETAHSIIGIPVDRAYRGTAREFAHCFAADGLIGLERLNRSGLLADQDKILLLCTSTNTWFLVALQYVAQ